MYVVAFRKCLSVCLLRASYQIFEWLNSSERMKNWPDMIFFLKKLSLSHSFFPLHQLNTNMFLCSISIFEVAIAEWIHALHSWNAIQLRNCFCTFEKKTRISIIDLAFKKVKRVNCRKKCATRSLIECELIYCIKPKCWISNVICFSTIFVDDVMLTYLLVILAYKYLIIFFMWESYA